MAIANLHETLMTYTLRANELQVEISNWESQKSLASYAQADAETLKAAESRDIRAQYKDLYDGDEDLQEIYIDYTEMPDYEAEIDKLTAKYQDEFDELTAWETILDSYITTASAELEEVNAYKESVSTMLSSNIQEDFNYGLNG